MTGWHPGSKCYEDFEVGGRYVTPGRTMTEADIQAYAGLSGDFHAYHTDDVVAREGAFGGRICHGPLTLAVMSGLFRSRLGLFDGTGVATLGVTKVRFSKPVRPGDTIHGELEVISRRESRSRPHCGIVVLGVAGYIQNGDQFLECEWTELVCRSAWREQQGRGEVPGRRITSFRVRP